MGANKNYCNCKRTKNEQKTFKEQGYNGFPQINKVPFKFSRINQRPLALMDVCNKCFEINTVPLT